MLKNQVKLYRYNTTLGYCLYRKKNWKEAGENFYAASQYFPDNLDIHRLYIECTEHEQKLNFAATAPARMQIDLTK